MREKTMHKDYFLVLFSSNLHEYTPSNVIIERVNMLSLNKSRRLIASDYETIASLSISTTDPFETSFNGYNGHRVRMPMMKQPIKTLKHDKSGLFMCVIICRC